MQALILAGGEGTRLRPLTSTLPKPVVPMVGRPFIAYMLDWVRAHDVDDVVMSCGHMAAAVRDVLGDGSREGLRLRYVDEPRPLGTGGAVKYAERLLDRQFLMLNGDVLADLDLTAVIRQHHRTGARATLALVAVEDPSAYGLVRTGSDGQVSGFLEKPAPHEIDTNQVSAGAYVLERDVLELLAPDEPASIEREVFPRLAGQGLYGCLADGYWLDIGTPERYLEASFDILEGRVSARIGEAVTGGPGAIIAPDATVGRGARIARSVVMRGAHVAEDCELQDCIVAARARIGHHARLTGFTVVGEGAVIDAHVALDGGRIAPGATVTVSAAAAMAA
jgi:mannose-1-phosphate guanylyltransferase